MAKPPIIFACPGCGSTQTRVWESRGSWDADQATRLRECKICWRRFGTEETITQPLIASRRKNSTAP